MVAFYSFNRLAGLVPFTLTFTSLLCMSIENVLLASLYPVSCDGMALGVGNAIVLTSNSSTYCSQATYGNELLQFSTDLESCSSSYMNWKGYGYDDLSQTQVAFYGSAIHM